MTEICCDTCPFLPTCEEIEEFHDRMYHAGDFEWGDDDSA